MVLYFFSEAIRNIRDNPLTSLVAVATIAFSLTIFGIFGIFFVNTKGVLDSWGSQVQVTVYLVDGISEDRLSTLRRQMTGMREVEGVDYITKERAYLTFKEGLKGEKGVVEGLTANPFPASLELRIRREFRNSEGVKGLISRLKGLDGVDDIQYGQEWVERFSAFLGFVKVVGVIIGIFLLIATVFTISNTIKLTLYARKDEIEIMRLVGATDLFIKTPFLIEGMVEGLLGAILAIAFIYGGMYLLMWNVPIHFIRSVDVPPFLLMGLLIGGLFLGALGSITSVRRFLRV